MMAYVYYDYQTGMFSDIEEEYDNDLMVDEPISNTLSSTYHSCAVPSTIAIFWHMIPMMGWSLTCRAGWVLTRRFPSQHDTMKHIISIATGGALLFTTSGMKSIIVAALVLCSYSLMVILKYFRMNNRNMGITVVAFAIVSHLTYELLLNQPSAWQGIRGPIMIANMKAISLAFEQDANGPHGDNTQFNLPTVLPFLGYMFAPATLLMGPWVPYRAYKQSLQLPAPNRRQRYRWLLWCLLCSVVSVGFVNLSNCISPLICTDRAPIWFKIYRDAFAVRCSHYFISFLSQSLMAANGISRNKEVKPNAWLGHMVSRPLNVEFPRSINALVRNWNIPMHDFLKNYIFSGTYRRFGNHILAIFITYLVSALLHGYHVQIYLVLLSLPFFAYVEVVFRKKLALAFDACIAANPCQRPCRYKYCSSHGWRSEGAFNVTVVNLGFAILSSFHLAYLGVMMNDNESDSFEKDSVIYGLAAWSKVNYLNHWIVLATYGLHFIL